jgi:hypothetical protein
VIPRPRTPAGAIVAPLALAVLALLAAVALGARFDGTFVQNDSAQYVSMAKNLVSGHGLATSLVWTDEQHRLGGLPVAQTNLPPGYPALIALVSQLGVEPLAAAFLVSAACFALIPLVVYFILTAVGRPAGLSFVVSATWLGLPLIWFNVLACLSEMSYTLLTVLALACLARSEGDPARPHGWLLLAGALAGLAFTVRYAGVAYVASMGAWFLLQAARRRDWRSLRGLIVVMLPPAIIIAALFTRTYWLTGRLVGGLRGDEGNAIGTVLASLYWSLSEASGFSKTGLLRGDLAEWLLVAVVVMAIVCVAAGVRPGLRWSALRALGSESVGAVSLIYVLGSLVFMILAASAHASGVVAARYLLPLIPFVLVLVPYGLGLLRREQPARGRRTMLRALRWGAVAALLAGQVDVIAEQRRLLARPYVQIDRALQQPFATGTLREFLGREITLQAPLLGNEAQLAGAVLDRPTVGLPGTPYTRTVWTTDQTRRVVHKYGVAYVVFFPDLFDPAAPDGDNQLFFRDLKQGRVPAWLTPAFSSGSVQLYQVNGMGA